MSSPVRIDKWLWAARFFKTRALAREAISGGKVHLNGYRVKPGRALKPGDSLRVQRGEEEYTINVIEISTRRGPATVAQLLYAETEEAGLHVKINWSSANLSVCKTPHAYDDRTSGNAASWSDSSRILNDWLLSR